MQFIQQYMGLDTLSTVLLTHHTYVYTGMEQVLHCENKNKLDDIVCVTNSIIRLHTYRWMDE